MGLYRSGGTYCTQCEAEGFRRITYFPDRPDVLAVYTTRIEAEKTEAPVLLANGNLVGIGRHSGHEPPLRGLARPVPEAVLSVRPGRRRPRPASRTRFVTTVGPRGRARASMSSTARRIAAATPWIRSSASMRWDETTLRPRIRSRRVHDRRRVRLQHGRDGEQGPQHLQRQIRARFARDRHRRRLRQHRGRHRARIFPQLDRQPHHLSRLVPALPEGRADGLSRPGIHLR